MAEAKLEQEIAQLADQLRTLRLPHKLNQYRVYEKRLQVLNQEAASVSHKSYRGQLDQLQSQLDDSVLCGVNQCFICGSAQSAVPNRPLPVYSRSVSAGVLHKSSYSTFPTTNGSSSAQVGKYGKPISYHHQLSSKDEALLQMVTPPTPPASIHSEDSSDLSEIKGNHTLHQPDELIKPVSEEIVEDSSGSNAESSSLPSDNHAVDITLGSVELNHVATSENNQNGEQSYLSDQVPKQETSSWTSKIIDVKPEPELEPKGAECAQNTTQQSESKVPIKSSMVGAGPLPFRGNTSYRAYKDFVNNYSSSRAKSSEVSEKRAG